MNDSDRRHVSNLKEGIRELLELNPADSTALILLGLALPGVDGNKREHAWATLTDIQDDIRLIHNGTVPPGYFDDLGDGVYRDVNLAGALEMAERNLDDVLDDLVSGVRPSASRAA